MLSRALKEVKLPFPDDFFPELVVTAEDDAIYRQAAETKLVETLRAESPATRFHPAQQTDQWKLIGDRQGVQLYRERGVAKGNAVQVVCLGSLNGTLEDVMWGLYAPTTLSLKTQRSIMHSDYLDAAVLHVLDAEECDEVDTAFSYRFSGLKWLASAPSGKLMHKRDLCWHECMGLANDLNGQEVGFLVMQSVRVEECPPFDHHGLIRSSASVCYIFRKLPNGNVGVYMNGDHAVGGKSRSWSSDSVIVEMWLSIANVLECTQSKRLSRLVRGKNLFCATQNKKCDICDQKVSILKSAEFCKICGKNVCDKCRMSKPIYPTANSNTFPCVMPFCKRCLSDAKDQTYMGASRVSFHSEKSSSQDSGSGTYRQSISSSRTGVYSIYSSQSAPPRTGAPPPHRSNSRLVQPRDQYYSNGNVQIYSPTSSSRSGHGYAPSVVSSYSDGAVPSSSFRPRPAPPSASAPGSREQSFQSPFGRAYASSAGSTNSQRYGSGSIDSTYDVDSVSSFIGRTRLSSDPMMGRDGSEDPPIVELPVSISSARAPDLYDDEQVVEVVRSTPTEREIEEPVDVFHEDKLKYINSFQSNSSGGLSNPGIAGSYAGSDERAQLMERLLQANMAAEATYLLAKYSSNLANQTP